MAQRSGNDLLLRNALRANAAFSAMSAAALLLASSRLSRLFGAPRSALLVIGIVLVLFAVDLIATASRKKTPRGKVYYFVAMDISWVVGSCIVLLLPTPLTPDGRLAVIAVALVVAVFAGVQAYGLHSSNGAPDSDAPAGARP